LKRKSQQLFTYKDTEPVSLQDWTFDVLNAFYQVKPLVCLTDKLVENDAAPRSQFTLVED